MIYMGVSQDYMINPFRLEHKVAVHAVGLKAFALEHSAIEKYPLSCICRNEKLTACNFPRSTNKLDFHRITSVK
jgi:hypothetical protein